MATQKATQNGNHNQPPPAVTQKATPPRPEVRSDAADGFESSSMITHVWVPKVGERRVCVFMGETEVETTAGRGMRGFEVRDKADGKVLTVVGADATRFLPHLNAGEEVAISRGKNARIKKGQATESYDFAMKPEVRRRVDAAVKAADERVRAEAASKDASKA